MPKKMKQTKVTRKFLLNLARDIFDPKTRRFLRLCDGTLQNGPDPTNPRRPMHCGLGELYFAMTGLQPEETGVEEDGVVDLACERAGWPVADTIREVARSMIDKMNLPEDVKSALCDVIDSSEDGDLQNGDEQEFRSILDSIPKTNDDGKGDNADDQDDVRPTCSISDYRDRSKNVAAKLRAAAKLLPA
jgi:hypothetical protein